MTVILLLLLQPEVVPPEVVSKAVMEYVVVLVGATVILGPVPAPSLQVYLYPGLELLTVRFVLFPLQIEVDPDVLIAGGVLTVTVTGVLFDSQVPPSSAT